MFDCETGGGRAENRTPRDGRATATWEPRVHQLELPLGLRPIATEETEPPAARLTEASSRLLVERLRRAGLPGLALALAQREMSTRPG